MDRYRVRVKGKSWSTNGPDLLRTVASASEAATQVLHDRGPWSWRKQRPSGGFFPWREVGVRKAIAPFLDETLPTLSGGQLAQLGHGVGIAAVELRAEAVLVPDLVNATGSAETTHALVRHHFPDVQFRGCFSCKQYNRGPGDPVLPNVGWSDPPGVTPWTRKRTCRPACSTTTCSTGHTAWLKRACSRSSRSSALERGVRSQRRRPIGRWARTIRPRPKAPTCGTSTSRAGGMEGRSRLAPRKPTSLRPSRRAFAVPRRPCVAPGGTSCRPPLPRGHYDRTLTGPRG